MSNSQIENVVKKDLTWLQAHERLLICTMLLGVVLFLGNRYLDSSAARSQARADVAAQQVADAKLSAQQAQAQAAQAAVMYQETVREQQSQISALVAGISARNSALAHQQAQVQTAPMTDVANQWQGAIGGQGDITVAQNGLNISETGARRTLSQLIELPVVKANLADEKNVTVATEKQRDAANAQVSALNTQVSALNAQTKAEEVACKAEVASVKAEARKSKRNWLIVGTVAGVAIRSVIHAYIGI